MYSYIDIYIRVCSTTLILVIAITNHVLRSFVVHCFVFLHFEYIFSTQSRSSTWGEDGYESVEGIPIRSSRESLQIHGGYIISSSSISFNEAFYYFYQLFIASLCIRSSCKVYLVTHDQPVPIGVKFQWG